jgi:hypothetical protein
MIVGIMLFRFGFEVLRVICCASLPGWACWWSRVWVKDSDFYQQALGLQSPWRVEQVESDVQSQRVMVGVGNKAMGFILEAKADVLIRGEAG